MFQLRSPYIYIYYVICLSCPWFPALQQIHDVEHLWRCSDTEMASLRQTEEATKDAMLNESPEIISNYLCKIADQRLFKIVKWCKNLPPLRHISVSMLLDY